MELDKNSIDAQPSTVKKIFLFLATVLLSCMAFRKYPFGTILSQKKQDLLHVTLKKFNGHSTFIEKVIVSNYYSTMVHGTWK